jgi:hypothetical protein
MYDRNRRLPTGNPPAKLEAVEPGQTDIGEHEIDAAPSLLEQLQRFHGVARSHHRLARELECHPFLLELSRRHALHASVRSSSHQPGRQGEEELVSRTDDGVRREARRIGDRMHAIGETGTRAQVFASSRAPSPCWPGNLPRGYAALPTQD